MQCFMWDTCICHFGSNYGRILNLTHINNIILWVMYVITFNVILIILNIWRFYTVAGHFEINVLWGQFWWNYGRQHLKLITEFCEKYVCCNLQSHFSIDQFEYFLFQYCFYTIICSVFKEKHVFWRPSWISGARWDWIIIFFILSCSWYLNY